MQAANGLVNHMSVSGLQSNMAFGGLALQTPSQMVATPVPTQPRMTLPKGGDFHEQPVNQNADELRLISLGCYCGPKLTFRALGRDEATLPFDWVRTRIDGLLYFMRNNFDNFFYFDTKTLVPGTGTKNSKQMVMHRSFYHSFWHDDPAEKADQEKYKRRFERFNAIDASCNPVLFVRSVVSTDEMDHIDTLYSELLQRFGRQAMLLVIVDFQERDEPVLIQGKESLLIYKLHHGVHAGHNGGAPYKKPISEAIAWAKSGQLPGAAVAPSLSQLNLAPTSWGLMGLGGLDAFEQVPQGGMEPLVPAARSCSTMPTSGAPGTHKNGNTSISSLDLGVNGTAKLSSNMFVGAPSVENTFIVKLNKPAGASLGLVVDAIDQHGRFVHDGVALKILQLTQGIVPNHNLSAGLDNQIQIGDCIVEINGISGDSAAMIQQLQQQSILTVVIQRNMQTDFIPVTATPKEATAYATQTFSSANMPWSLPSQGLVQRDPATIPAGAPPSSGFAAPTAQVGVTWNAASPFGTPSGTLRLNAAGPGTAATAKFNSFGAGIGPQTPLLPSLPVVQMPSMCQEWQSSPLILSSAGAGAPPPSTLSSAGTGTIRAPLPSTLSSAGTGTFGSGTFVVQPPSSSSPFLQFPAGTLPLRYGTQAG